MEKAGEKRKLRSVTEEKSRKVVRANEISSFFLSFSWPFRPDCPFNHTFKMCAAHIGMGGVKIKKEL
jgi:hypothetical protein